MYKVLLVDDEPWILKDLSILIDWESYGFTIIATSSEAIEAKQFIVKYSPDLVICDIRMPGMTGLELMETVQKEQPDITFLFISAYNEFSYAVRAMQLGGFDYLMKPVAIDNLIEALTRVKFVLAERHHNRLQSLIMQHTLFMLDLLDQGGSHREIIGKLARKGQFQPKGETYLFLIAHTLDTSARHDAQHTLLQAVDTFTQIDPTISIMLGQNGLGKWFIFINYSQLNMSAYRKSLKLLHDIVNSKRMTFGISSPFTQLDRIRQYYREAERMVRMQWVTGEPGVYSHRPQRERLVSYWLEQIRQSKHVIELTDIVKMIIPRYKKDGMDTEFIAKIYNETLMRKAQFEGWLSEYDHEVIPTEELITLYDNPDSLFDDLLITVQAQRQHNSDPYNDIVLKVIREIETNYQARLSLAGIAKQHFINANYLSQLFKQSTGRTFMQHLLETRLNKATELLNEGKLSLQEVSHEVGYDDYFHFSKIFKKYRGISPSELRRSR